MTRWVRSLARWACTVPLVGALLGSSTLARAETVARSAPSLSAHSVPEAAKASGVVNLNEANADELERLPGIGPAKARAILDHRRARPFHKIDELTKVKGIGRKTLGKLRPYLTVAGPTTLRESTR